MMEEAKPSFIVRLGLGFLILFILYALLIPRAGNGTRTNKIGKAKSDLEMICSAIDEFKHDHGRYPTNAEGLGVLWADLTGIPAARVSYLSKAFDLDPWGNPYIYRTPWPRSNEGFMVESYGADGEPGGVDDAADIVDGVMPPHAAMP